MSINRRAALRGMIVAGAAMAGVRPAKAAPLRRAPADAVGLLYDTTRCIGCKACVAACREVNGLEPDPGFSDGLYHAPVALSANAKTVIKLYSEGETQSFAKMQCMHCVDPACVGACMLGALKKREYGIVTYDDSLCVGCRYCQMGCPYNVPKFEWAKVSPRIVKCELCNDRLKEGKIPACAEVCPREAVIFGKREEGWINRKKSVLDAVREDAATLKAALGKQDQVRLEEQLLRRQVPDQHPFHVGQRRPLSLA